MTHQDSAARVRDVAAVAIARALVNGQRIPDEILADFAQLDADAGMSFFLLDSDDHPGAAFGL